MGFESSKFNPGDNKYKKVADLPKKERDKYVDLNQLPWVNHDEEGFITKEAAKEDFDNYEGAKIHNRHRSIIDKALFRNKLSKTDIAQDKANELNKEIDEKK